MVLIEMKKKVFIGLVVSLALAAYYFSDSISFYFNTRCLSNTEEFQKNLENGLLKEKKTDSMELMNIRRFFTRD